MKVTLQIEFTNGQERVAPSNEDQLEIINNIAACIVHTVNTAGIVPDEAEYFTEKIIAEVNGQEHISINL